jgi:hypothetical protein
LQKPTYISIGSEDKEDELDGSSRFEDDFEANDRSQPAGHFTQLKGAVSAASSQFMVNDRSG